jgi:hypothetical protein
VIVAAPWALDKLARTGSSRPFHQMLEQLRDLPAEQQNQRRT